MKGKSNLYIFCAMYIEAAGIIEQYELKKEKANSRLKFDVFKNEEKGLVLTLTGVGAVNAAAAVSSICTFYDAGLNDRIVNIGTCAGYGLPGSILLGNKIINSMSGRTFYPDMLVKTDLKEGTIITVGKFVSPDQLADGAHNRDGAQTFGVTQTGNEAQTSEVGQDEIETVVYEMEAAGIFEVAQLYTAQHNISFIKIISDNGISGKEDPACLIRCLTEAMDSAKETIGIYINHLLEMEINLNEKEAFLESSEYRDYIAGISEDMGCSVSMKKRLEQYIRYAHLAGYDYKKVIADCYEEGLMPVKGKNEGKQVLDRIGTKLI